MDRRSVRRRTEIAAQAGMAFLLFVTTAGGARLTRYYCGTVHGTVFETPGVVCMPCGPRTFVGRSVLAPPQLPQALLQVLSRACGRVLLTGWTAQAPSA